VSIPSEPDVSEGVVPERVWRTYLQWCEHYGKVCKEDRLRVFQQNFLVLEEYFMATGIAIDMNEYADLSAEEYKQIYGG
jgi:hypothetical protein